MSRLIPGPHGRSTLRLVSTLVLGMLLSSCGGSSGSSNTGGNNSSAQAGPSAVLNGASLASATTHWVSAQCHVQAELTSDSGFWSVVVDTSGTTSSGSETWTIGPDKNSITVGPGSGLKGFFWISALGEISGSTSSKVFTANVVVETSSNVQNLGSCTFTLAQGALS